MSQQDLLNHLESEIRAQLEEVRAEFVQLDPANYQVRPDPESWNIPEGFAHLNRYLEDYIPGLERAIHKAKARRWTPGQEVRYSSRGRRAVQRANPENGKSYKAKIPYNFGHLPVGPEVIKSFIINSERLLRVVNAAREVDINRATVKKMHSWIGKYTIANLLEFLVTHSRRHLIQAKRLIRNSGHS